MYNHLLKSLKHFINYFIVPSEMAATATGNLYSNIHLGKRVSDENLGATDKRQKLLLEDQHEFPSMNTSDADGENMSFERFSEEERDNSNENLLCGTSTTTRSSNEFSPFYDYTVRICNYILLLYSKITLHIILPFHFQNLFHSL